MQYTGGMRLVLAVLVCQFVVTSLAADSSGFMKYSDVAGSPYKV